MPERIQRKRSKGWKMPPNTVYVGRPGPFGNPFYIGQDGTHEECVELHRRWLCGELSSEEIRERFVPPNAEWLIWMRRTRLDFVRTLKGKNVACWCAPDRPCHADVLLEIANQ